MYITDEQFKKEMRVIKHRNKSNERKKALRDAKHPNKKALTTTKLIMSYLFIILNVVLVYCLIAMWHFADLNYLGALITAVVSQIVVFLVYCLKSAKENSKGGIVYETAMANVNTVEPHEPVPEDNYDFGGENVD